MERKRPKTVRERIMELGYMVADGKISQRDAERTLQEEEDAGELYDDLGDDLPMDGSGYRWLKR